MWAKYRGIDGLDVVARPTAGEDARGCLCEGVGAEVEGYPHPAHQEASPKARQGVTRHRAGGSSSEHLRPLHRGAASRGWGRWSRWQEEGEHDVTREVILGVQEVLLPHTDGETVEDGLGSRSQSHSNRSTWVIGYRSLTLGTDKE